MLVISTQNWSILAKFAKKIQRNRLFFTDCFLANFPPEISREIGRFFLEFAPKILRNLTFFRQNPTKSTDFPANFDFSPSKNPAKSADFWVNFDFFPVKSADFSANLPLKIPRNFAFFSAKYQKPWITQIATEKINADMTLLVLSNVLKTFK